MLSESIALYAAAIAGYLLAALSIAPMLGRGHGDAATRAVAGLMLALCALLGWRVVPPFWHALRIGLYDAQDALLSAAAAFVVLTLAGALRRVLRRAGRP
jgi:hypothetical protein